MSEVKAIEVLDAALSQLDSDARLRVLTWARMKFGGDETPSRAVNIPASPPAHQSSPTAAPKGKSSKKSKTIISMDKTLNLSPSGKVSAVDFGVSKAPSNVMQKCVVAVYYLRETIGMQKVTATAVFTFFKHLAWPVPADLKNTLQQAGTKGWLDSADSEDVKLTSLGENLVEHSLPAKSSTK